MTDTERAELTRLFEEHVAATQSTTKGLFHAKGKVKRTDGYARYHCVCGWRSSWYTREHDALAAIGRHLEETHA